MPDTTDDEPKGAIRSGGPIDEPGDLGTPIWAGHIPLSTVAFAPVADRDLMDDVAEPPYVRTYPSRRAASASVTPVDSRRSVVASGG
jgi:hypothetical protein